MKEVKRQKEIKISDRINLQKERDEENQIFQI
jgi:hypothetical protein